jgi:hypothetical protein
MKENLSAISLVVAMIALGSSALTLMQARNLGNLTPAPSAATSSEYESRIAALQRDLQKQRSDFEGFRQAFQSLANSGGLSGRNKIVVLDPASKSYGRIDTDNGFFLVSCQDVQPYLDGYKVTLHVGNPLGVRFVGFKITAQWGPRYTVAANDDGSWGRWRAGLKATDFSFTDTLEVGRWNEVELVLAQTTANQVGHIQVSLETNVVSMLVPQE